MFNKYVKLDDNGSIICFKKSDFVNLGMSKFDLEYRLTISTSMCNYEILNKDDRPIKRAARIILKQL